MWFLFSLPIYTMNSRKLWTGQLHPRPLWTGQDHSYLPLLQRKFHRKNSSSLVSCSSATHRYGHAIIAVQKQCTVFQSTIVGDKILCCYAQVVIHQGFQHTSNYSCSDQSRAPVTGASFLKRSLAVKVLLLGAGWMPGTSGSLPPTFEPRKPSASFGRPVVTVCL